MGFGIYGIRNQVIVLLQKKEICSYFIVKKINHINPFKTNFMKNQVYQKKTALSVFFHTLSKNFVALFESGNKKEFQRLKDFIAH